MCPIDRERASLPCGKGTRAVSSGAMVFHLFGYGSLITTPEHEERVIGRDLAVLPGYRRLFNKRSPTRGCPREDAFDAFAIPPAFERPSAIQSLAVGTIVQADASVGGVALEYAAQHEADVLRETDRREGYDASAQTAGQGYLRVSVTLGRPHLGDTIDSWTFLSNPGGPYDVDLTLDQRARILISATPRPETPTALAGRARGIGYLEQLRLRLFELGWIDPDLEQQALAILDHHGPWTSLVAPKRSLS
ncbi:MAG: cation transport regulator ChaC [Myxococcota bacterium]|jgi:cation transport regulator ChaC